MVDTRFLFTNIEKICLLCYTGIKRGGSMRSRINRSAFIAVFLTILAVAAASLCRYFAKYEKGDTLSIIRSAIYIVLFLLWGVSLKNRIVQAQVKRFMTAIAGLIVFWVTIRTVKFIIAENPVFVRVLWYMYYIPMIFIPLFALFVGFSLGKPENYCLPKITSVMYVVSALLFILVITNDLHCFVFRFPGNAENWSDRDYSYSAGYYIVAGYILCCTVCTLFVLISKCRIPKTKKMLVLPVLPIAAMIIYSILYVTGSIVKGSFIHTVAGDMTVTVSLLTALAFECCIHCGLIRSNTHYTELLRPCTLPALITDDDYNILLSSDCAERISKDVMRSSQGHPIMIGNGKRLSSAKIKGGHVLWIDDLSELIEVNDKLTEAKDDLKDEYDLLCEEYDLKNREAHILERDGIYNRIQLDTAGQIKILDRLTDEFELSGDENERRHILGKMLVFGAYLKRRNNLIFLSYKSDMISETELFLAFRELTDNLELYGVVCGLNIKTDSPIPSKIIMEMYDAFEKMIEISIDSITAVNIVIDEKDNIHTMMITADAENDLSVMNNDRITAVCDSDGEWQINYTSEERKCSAYIG